jgi:hypothetical protein
MSYAILGAAAVLGVGFWLVWGLVCGMFRLERTAATGGRIA